MPIEFGVWRIDGNVSKVVTSKMENEAKLEEILEKNIDILGLDLMVIGRQVITTYGTRIDLLAVNSEGSICVIEIKKDKTPRNIIAQLLDYGSWVNKQAYQDIVNVYEKFGGMIINNNKKFEEAFVDKFGKQPDSLNESHQLIIVASELDSSSERIVAYLSEYKVPINAVFFTYFKDGKAEYLGRTWLIDPDIVINNPSPKSKEPWNGKDYYVVIGEDSGHRNWDDCVKYGYVGAGQGKIYRDQLKNLTVNSRVFAYIPGKGYVGVGIVEAEAVMAKDFHVDDNGKKTPILEGKTVALDIAAYSDDPEKSEYCVKVKWIKNVSRENAIWEKGLFTNPNVVCKLRNRFTLEKLVKEFELED